MQTFYIAVKVCHRYDLSLSQTVTELTCHRSNCHHSALSKTYRDAETTPGQYNQQRRRDSRSLKTLGQQQHCAKSDRCPVSSYHMTLTVYKEFVFDLREAAEV